MMSQTGPMRLALAIGGLAALNPASALAAGDCATDEEIAAVRAEIVRNNRAIEDALAAGDIGAMASHFTEGAWQFPPNTAPLDGRAAIREHWTGLQAFGDWTFDLTTQGVSLCGPMAVERGAYVLTFEAGPEAPADMASFTDRGHYLVQWVRGDDGAWRIAADAPVSLGPAAGEAEGDDTADHEM